MLVKTDENLPKEVADLLRSSGHDAVRADEQRLSGATDSAIADVCRKERRVIVTLDTDFMDVRRYPPQIHFGIIVLRPRRQSIPQIVRMTSRVILLLDSEPLVGKLWIVDEGRIRIRPEDSA